jgi:hypothetical protein
MGSVLSTVDQSRKPRPRRHNRQSSRSRTSARSPHRRSRRPSSRHSSRLSSRYASYRSRSSSSDPGTSPNHHHERQTYLEELEYNADFKNWGSLRLKDALHGADAGSYDRIINKVRRSTIVRNWFHQTISSLLVVECQESLEMGRSILTVVSAALEQNCKKDLGLSIQGAITIVWYCHGNDPCLGFGNLIGSLIIDGDIDSLPALHEVRDWRRSRNALEDCLFQQLDKTPVCCILANPQHHYRGPNQVKDRSLIDQLVQAVMAPVLRPHTRYPFKLAIMQMRPAKEITFDDPGDQPSHYRLDINSDDVRPRNVHFETSSTD